MARRASGGRGGIVVPGVRERLVAYLRWFAQVWASDWAASLADQMEAGEPVEVTGEQIWRAVFDKRPPNAADEWMTDRSLYRVTGPDTVSLVDRG